MTSEKRAAKIATFKNDVVFSDEGTLMCHFDVLREQIAAEILAAVAEEREHILKTLEGNGELARIQGRAEAFEEAAKIAEGDGSDPNGNQIASEIRARAKETL